MRRMVFWIPIAALALILGVAATLLWLQFRRPAVEREVPVASAQSPQNDPNKDLPILAYCELANNPDKYNEQVVRVSTRLSGFIHGILFYDPNCSGVDTRAAVFYNPGHKEEIERDLKKARGSDNWLEPVDIIAVGKFKKVTPSNETDTIYHTASLQFEIIRIEKASKVH